MKTSVLLLGSFALGLFLAASAPAPSLAASGRVTFKVGDSTRSAIVTERYRSKRKLRPAIIVLREPARPQNIRRGLRFQDFAKRGGVLVYADAAGGWRLGPNGEAADEVAYLKALVDRLRTASRADPRRIYLVGVGAAGVVALQAACAEPRLFAVSPRGSPACRPNRWPDARRRRRSPCF